MVSAVRGFYKFLMFEGHVEKNPADDLVSPNKGVYLPRFLNQSEIESLLAAPDVSTESGSSRSCGAGIDVCKRAAGLRGRKP